MSTTSPSKYAENTFQAGTVNSFPLMGELLADTVPRAVIAVGSDTTFLDVIANLTFASGAWTAGQTTIANAEAAQPGRTLAFDDFMASLTRKPDADTNSLLETWDTTIRGQVAYQGPTYMILLPQGRETLTNGTREEQLDAIRDFGERLADQTTKPLLVTLGATVGTFATAARALRTTQTTSKAALETARQAQENLRLNAATALYSLIGQGMVRWGSDPARVDTLWDVNILRNAPQQVPEAPADTTWDGATRTLATTALPAGATRLEAWRVGPGSMPELLLTAGPGATSILIPATITFTPGGLYQLWLVAINSKGRSAAGPVQSWTAV
ncbi:MAG: hypothetical protein V4689_15400 [Verrucomicrobiota bacterium]